MTWTRRIARPALGWLGLTGAILAGAPGPASAQPQDLFYERTAIAAAGARCGLFAPELAAALEAGAAQARNAALRAGADVRSLQATQAEARAKAMRIDCRSADMATIAARVQSAFAGYAKVTRMTYPGEIADWRADRQVTRDPRWRLSQETRFAGGRMIFGLAGRDTPGVLAAVAEFAGDDAPYAARLLVRDKSRTLGPYLPGGGRAALGGRLPPRTALKAYTAEARSPAGADLLPHDSKAGWTFRFPAAAAAALAGLDPREAVAVEFLMPRGDTLTAYVEVGDFAAGQAFLTMAANR